MALDLSGYRKTIQAQAGYSEAQNWLQNEIPGFNMFGDTSTGNQTRSDVFNVNNQTPSYDSERLRVEALNKEVEYGLGSRIDDVMTEQQKKRYINSLSHEQYQQMLKYRDEGYGFMASKTLLEDAYKLADPTATGVMKYKNFEEKQRHYQSLEQMKAASDSTDSGLFRKLSNYWEEALGFREDREKGQLGFASRFADLTLGNIIRGLDKVESQSKLALDEIESKAYTFLDRVVNGYDTAWDFYDKDREGKIVDHMVGMANGAINAALGAIGLLPNPYTFAATSALSTKPGEKAVGWGMEKLDKIIDFSLDYAPLLRHAYHYLSPQAQDDVRQMLSYWVVGKTSKYAHSKIDAKAGPYIDRVNEAWKRGLEGAKEGNIAQQGFEKYQGTTRESFIDPVTGEVGTFESFNGYKPGATSRIGQATREGFVEGWKQGWNNPSGTQQITPYVPPVKSAATPSAPSGIGATVNGWRTDTGMSMYRSRNKMTTKNRQNFKDKFGEEYSDFMVDRGWMGGYQENLPAMKIYLEGLQDQKQTALNTISKTYSDPWVDQMLDAVLEHSTDILDGYADAFQGLKLKNQSGKLTPGDIEYIRRYFQYNLPTKWDMTTTRKTVQRNNNIYNGVKNLLERIAEENGISEYRELNQEISKTYSAMDGIMKYYNKEMAKQEVTLGEMMEVIDLIKDPSPSRIWKMLFGKAVQTDFVQKNVINKLLENRIPEEAKQMKIDLKKIQEIQDGYNKQKAFDEWIKKYNVDLNALPESTQGGVVAGDKGFVTENGPTAESLGIGGIQELGPNDFLYQGGDTGVASYSQGKNLKLGEGYYFGGKKQASRFGDDIVKIKNKKYKVKEFKSTNEYQVEASKFGGKDAYNKMLQEQGYEGIKAYNPAFEDFEYNFFTDVFNK